jgi:thiamine biosynthesis protein ThiI
MTCVLVRYAEIGLKGKNRILFEKKLAQNIRNVLEQNKVEVEKITRPYGRLIVFTKGHRFLRSVFGIASYSPAVKTTVETKAMADTALQMVELHPGVSFRVSCQRLDKSLTPSKEIEKQFGAEIVARTGAMVDLTDYDIEVGVELIEGAAYVFTERVICFGGLPVGSQGKVLAVINNAADELAALLIMHRGCEVIPVCFSEYPLRLLRVFGCTAPQQRIADFADIDDVARESNAHAVVVGQSLEHLSTLPTNLLVLRPLISYDEKQTHVKLHAFQHTLSD